MNNKILIYINGMVEPVEVGNVGSCVVNSRDDIVSFHSGADGKGEQVATFRLSGIAGWIIKVHLVVK